MAIVFTAATTSASNVIVDPSTAPGQFVLFGFNDDDNPINPITMPSGCVQQLNTYEAGDGGNAVVCTQNSSAGGGGNLTFQASFSALLVAISYTGVDTTTPINASATTNASGTGSGATWTVTAPSVTTTVDGCQIIIVICTDHDLSGVGTITSATATGFTNRGIANPTGTHWDSVTILDANQATHGATGTTTVTMTMAGAPTGGWVVDTIALAPASGGGGIGPIVETSSVRACAAYARIRQSGDVLGRLTGKPWVDVPTLKVQPAPRRASVDLPLPAQVLGPLPTWSVDPPAQRTPNVPRRIAQDVTFKGASAAAIGPIVDVPAMRSLPALARVALDQVLVTPGTDWAQDAQPLRAVPPPVRVQQDTPLPAQQVLPVWSPEGSPSRAMPAPVRVQQDMPLPAQQVLPVWSTEGPSVRALLAFPRIAAQDAVLPGFVSAALVSWVPDAAAVRVQSASRRMPGDQPLPVRVLPALLGWSTEYPSVRVPPAPRSIAQYVPINASAAVAALAWATEAPPRRAMSLPTRLAQDVPINGLSVTWTPDVATRRAGLATQRVLQDVPLPAPRVALPWVPDGAQMFAQHAPRAVRFDPAVFAPLPLAVVLDVVQMRVQSTARRIAPDVPALPSIAGLLIAWTPDVYYPRARVPSSYYAGAYVLPGLSAMLRPASGPQHRTAYGSPRLRIASEKPRNRTAYGSPRLRIAR